MKALDKQAVNILLKFDFDNPDETSSDDFIYAKNAGLMFDALTLSHDEIVEWALQEYAATSKSSVVRNFLYGIGRHEPRLRAALSAYAIMTHFPRHAYVEKDCYCGTCGLYPSQEVSRSYTNRCRWWGAILSRSPERLAFYLQQHNQEEVEEVSEVDIDSFCSILDIVSSAAPNEGPTKLFRRISKIPDLKMSAMESRFLLDTLGYAGILQTQMHQGYIYKYTGPLNPSKTHSSDWGYPVDFWTGKDGINTDALKYWFSDHPKIANWGRRKSKI